MKRPPGIPDEVHAKVNLCSTHNGLTIAETYPVLLDAILDKNGRLNDDMLEELQRELPAEDQSVF